MAAELAGTAAIRLVPSLTGFRSRAQTELARQKGLSVDVEIRPKVDTSVAKKQLERFRAAERADAINLKAKIDEADFKRQFQRVEHVFERSAFAKAFRLQIKVIGMDALYSLVGVAGSAAAALDTVAKSAVILPGALAAAGVAAGVFAAALGDVKKAITAVQTEQDQAADKARAYAGAQQDSVKASRDVKRAQEDVGRAVRQSIRNYEDLAHAVRGTSLDEADALLNVQESYDKLLQGGQKTLTELRRDQLSYARDLQNLDGVRIQNKRTLEDFNQAQREGVAGSQGVVQALDSVADAQNRVADAATRMADASQTKTSTGAFARLSPAAQEFVHAITDADTVWVKFTGRLQEGVFQGQATNLIDTLNTSIQNLGPGLDRVASQIGGVFTDLGSILRRDDIQGFLGGIIEGTGSTLSTLRKGLDPLITGFLRLAEVGAKHLPQLMDVFNRLFEQFNAWTTKVAADGTLDRWITNGIRGVEQLWNTGKNLVLIINDIANAWRLAGGESTGMIANAEDLTTQIHAWTSGSGMQTMVTSFKNIREWTGNIVDAFKNIWPSLVNIAQTAREWSVTFFTILGYALRLTEWVNDHTGLVKFMVAAYLSIRTVKPIWDTLTNAAQAYTNVLQRAATLNGPAGSFAKRSVEGLATVQTAMGKTGTDAQTLSATFTTTQTATQTALKNTGTVASQQAQGPLKTLQSAFMNLITPVNSTAGQIRSLNGFLPPASNNMTVMGNSASTAASKVGTSAATGLWGAAAGLGAFLGPMAIAMVATGGIVWALDKMGEAHRKAAAEAQNQKNQLDALKSTLDQFTGAFTAQTAIDTAKTAQDFQTTAFGKRNILQDIAGTGVASPEALIGATNPVNQAQRTAISDQLRQGAIQRIQPFLDQTTPTPGGPLSNRKRFADAGISENDIVGVLSGDQGAIDKFKKAIADQGFAGGDPRNLGSVESLQQGALQSIPPEAWNFLTSLQFLNTTSGGNVAQGAQNQFGANAAFGAGHLKPGAEGFYGPGATVNYTSPDTAKVVTSGPVGPDFVKNFPSDVGTVEILPDGRAQIQLTREGTLRDVEHMATGGMIRGVGSGTSDSNLIAASRGEFIVRKAAVDAIGATNLDRINSMRFDAGGLIGGMPFPLAPGPILPAPPAPPVVNTPPPPITPPVAAPPPVVSTPYVPTVPEDPAAPTLDPASIPNPQIPMTTGMPYSPSASGAPAYNSTPLPPNMGPGPFGPVPVQTDTMDDTIASYLTNLAKQNGLRVGALSSDPDFNAKFGAGLHDNDGGWHPNKRALDIGNGPDDLALAQWWVQDPARVATTKELILNVPGWDTGLNIKDGKFIRDYGGGVYDQGTLNGHTDHMHLALSGVPNSQGAISVGGMPISYGAYGQGGAGAIPGLPGGGGKFDFGSYIQNMYTEAYKPENVQKFLLGQVENVGQQMASIGLTFLKGFTGLDFSQAAGIVSQVGGNFDGSNSSKGDKSSLEAGSPMDNQISGDISQFFDPNGGVNIAAAVAAAKGNGSAGGVVPGPTSQAKADILKYIIAKAQRLGYTKQQAIWFATQAFGESGLSPGAHNAAGWDGIFQFDQSTWNMSGGGDIHEAQRNVDNYFKLAAQRHLTPQNFTDPTQLGTQVSIGGPYHPDNAAKGDRAKAEAGIGPLLAAAGFADGGVVPARVSRGEYRMSPKAVSHYGVGFMHGINGFAAGGRVWSPKDRRTKNSPPNSALSPGSDTPPGMGSAPWFIHGVGPLGPSGGGVGNSVHMLGGFAGGGMPAWIGPGGQGAGPDPTYGQQLKRAQSERKWWEQGQPNWVPAEQKHAAGGLIRGFAGGGFPFLPQGMVIPNPSPGGPGPLPIPVQTQAQPPQAPRPAGPPSGGAQQIAPAPAPVGPSTGPQIGAAAGTSAGQIPDFNPFQPGMPTGQQPLPAGMVMPDPRVSYQGAAPTTNQHNVPWADAAIKQGFAHAGAIMATIASMAAGAGSMGMGGGAGGAAAGSLIQGGMQMAGQFASGLLNVLSSAGVGTVAGIGTKATPSGAPLLPQNPVMGFGKLPDQGQMQGQQQGGQGGGNGPLIMNVYNGGIHTQNMDEWQRRQQLLERQQEQPLTNTFAH